MEDDNESLIGKEIICFEFESDNILNYSSPYIDLIGLKGVILNLHSTYPAYANVEINLPDGRIVKWHYPVKLIKEQIEAKESLKSVDELFEEFKSILH